MPTKKKNSSHYSKGKTTCKCSTFKFLAIFLYLRNTKNISSIKQEKQTII